MLKIQAHSNDLRSRIIEAYKNKEGSIRQIAKRFAVAPSTVWRLLLWYKKTGKVDPKPHGGGREAKIDKEGMKILRNLVKEKSDATIEELQKRFEKKTQIIVSKSSVGRALLKLKLPVKKNATFNRTR